MSLRRFAVAALIASVTFFIATVGSATVLEELSLEQMTSRSDAIVHGVVVSSGSRWAMDDNEPVTVTELRVLRWVKGGDAPTITIRERGGVVQDRGMWVAGTPRYAPNEEVVVFLERHPMRPDEYRTFGMAMGKFRVSQGIGSVPASVERDLEGVAFARWAEDGTMTVEHPGNEPAMHLETFLDFVAASVRGGAR